MQNLSHAVMAQRAEPRDSADDFPTPPWATRALVEHVIGGKPAVQNMNCLEPACGAGHMARPLEEYFENVDASDVLNYGFGKTSDFLSGCYKAESYDWVVTNPPFKCAEEFVHHATPIARVGVAILARTVFIESVGRFTRLFNTKPPTFVAQFTERVPMVKGRLDRKASTATGYAWLVWVKRSRRDPRLVWIPPCRKQLERDTDYIERPKPVEKFENGERSSRRQRAFAL